MKTLIWKKTLPWELFEARTATERFFTVDKVKQNNSNANIWSCNENDYQVSQCPNQYWSQEDLDMEENPPMGALLSKNCYRKVFHCGQNTNTNIIGKLCKTRERITEDDVSWSLILHPFLSSLNLMRMIEYEWEVKTGTCTRVTRVTLCMSKENEMRMIGKRFCGLRTSMILRWLRKLFWIYPDWLLIMGQHG